MSDTGVATAEDVIPNLVANTGTFSSLHGIPNCRAIRFVTAGAFVAVLDMALKGGGLAALAAVSTAMAILEAAKQVELEAAKQASDDHR